MSGFSVCNRLKRALPATPLILYTREATDGAIEAHRASKGKADAYLRAPLDMADLLGHAAQLLHAEATAHGAAGRAGDRAGRRPWRAAPPRRAAAPARTVALPAQSRPRPPLRPGSRPPGCGPTSCWPSGRAIPPPPKGTPEEKLEYFRERLRVRDGYMPRLREAIGELKTEAAQVIADGEELRATLAAAGQPGGLAGGAARRGGAGAGGRRRRSGPSSSSAGRGRRHPPVALRGALGDDAGARAGRAAVVGPRGRRRRGARRGGAGARRGPGVRTSRSCRPSPPTGPTSGPPPRRRGSTSRPTRRRRWLQLDAERLADREAARTAAEAASAQLVELSTERDELEHNFSTTASKLADVEEAAEAAARLAAETQASLEARLAEIEGRARAHRR